MKITLIFLSLVLFFQENTSRMIKGRVVSCIENEKSFYIEVQLDNKKDKISTLIFTDKKEVVDLISFVKVNDSIFQVLKSGYIDVKKSSQENRKIIKRFKLPEPMKPQLQKIIK
jgi:hypothetical protein